MDRLNAAAKIIWSDFLEPTLEYIVFVYLLLGNFGSVLGICLTVGAACVDPRHFWWPPALLTIPCLPAAYLWIKNDTRLNRWLHRDWSAPHADATSAEPPPPGVSEVIEERSAPQNRHTSPGWIRALVFVYTALNWAVINWRRI